MRHYNENDKYDVEEALKNNLEQWHKDLLAMNPGYTCWGSYEDYMCDDGDGWNRRIIEEEWDGGVGLDDYNEVANFYFEIVRPAVPCKECGQIGLNPETKRLADAWYRHSCPPGEEPWAKKLEAEEVEALAAHGRLNGYGITEFGDYSYRYNKDESTWKRALPGGKWESCNKPTMPSPDVVNKMAESPMFHDAINRMVCVEARAKKLGLYGLCPHCNGDGYIYTSAEPQVSLQLWLLHPRKGASRGVFYKSIKKNEIPEVLAYLAQCRDRIADKFSRVNPDYKPT
jgi:hypothetical protein